ncbi:hypothetical protein [Variovorax sp. YR216]|uniref:hypothetical protein n=1 Tax=Variovorax sp. YR216 TaxID=1882828 RepID=UPI000895DFE8|nr:hypothetical protein [Variovorax sp. YR216]SEA74383.1 hypothetical protein SAMN05444680_103377 [Variovorax sp. YR216]
MTAIPQDPPTLLTDEDRQKIRALALQYPRRTTPEDRYRALLEAGELLAAIGFRPYDHHALFGTRLPEHLQQLARSALANFPQPGELLSLFEQNLPLEAWLRLPPDVLEKFRQPLNWSSDRNDSDSDF